MGGFSSLTLEIILCGQPEEDSRVKKKKVAQSYGRESQGVTFLSRAQLKKKREQRATRLDGLIGINNSHRGDLLPPSGILYLLQPHCRAWGKVIEDKWMDYFPYKDFVGMISLN